MDYILITLGMVAFIVGVLVLLARAYPGNGSDLVDWKPTRDYETEIQLEQDDIAQMIAAQNDYRRRRGARELTERDAERMAREDQRVRQRGRMDEESLAKLDGELRRRPDPVPEDGDVTDVVEDRPDPVGIGDRALEPGRLDRFQPVGTAGGPADGPTALAQPQPELAAVTAATDQKRARH